MAAAGGESIKHRYRVLCAMGKGTVGDVFEVEDVDRGQHCALTLLTSAFRDDPSLQQKVMQSARRAECVRHASVAKVLDSGICGRRGAYIVRELTVGQTLEQLQRINRLPTELTCAVGIQVLSAIAANSEHDIAHHGLTPSNVIAHLDDDESISVKVADFGLVCGPLAEGTNSPWHASTLRYAAPELLRGEPGNARSDLYSVGALLYELLSGRRFLSGTPVGGLSERILIGDHDPLTRLNPGLPEPLVRAVDNALEPNPELRVRTAQEFARQLTPFLPAQRRFVSSWVPVSIDPVLEMSAKLFGLEEDANPSLRLLRAPRPHNDSACPAALLRTPVFPKSPRAPALDALRAAAFGKPKD